MSKFKEEIVDLIKESVPPPKEINKWVGEVYLGSKRPFLGMATTKKRQLAGRWRREHQDLSYDELIDLLDSLFIGDSFEEATIASELLNQFPHHRANLELDKIYEWLGCLNGWGEIDALCQRTFPAKELLARWPEWRKFLVKLNQDSDIRRRRASVVLLCKSLKESPDPRLSELAFKNVSKLQHEREILITKAVSWVLRELIKYHKEEVATYIDNNEDKLPRIAVRETRRKLSTGKK